MQVNSFTTKTIKTGAYELAKQELKRDLKNRHVQLIAIGGTIGTGLFLGSGKAIQLAGPSIIILLSDNRDCLVFCDEGPGGIAIIQCRVYIIH